MLGDGADIRNNCGKLALSSPTEDAKNMLTKMLAVVIFLNPNDLNRGSAELIEHDFDVQYLDDWIDDDGPAVWVNTWTLSDLDDDSFFDWVQYIVEPVGGEVLEAGPWYDAGALPGLPTNGSPRPMTIIRLS